MASNPTFKPSLIRNFCIIAHIDHGKSTLADRLIQKCHGLSEREMRSQVLDTMELEQERGITIKSQSVSLFYQQLGGETYQFNLIDTPGHVDFSYEVSRSLSACEGALLVVDATQGVQTQTLANCYSALENDLEIIPVLNKTDLPSANPPQVCAQIEQTIGLSTENSVSVSAKTGEGVDELLDLIVSHIPAPKTQNYSGDNLQALIIDSWFDAYLGVVSLVRVFCGSLEKGQKLRMASSNLIYQVESLGFFTPKRTEQKALTQGQVGYVVLGVKDLKSARVGDTLLGQKDESTPALVGFEKIQPKVFAGIFPCDSNQYPDLRQSLEKLSLNDASLAFEPETSDALGFGFRAGFLGVLHMEIIQERLEREYNLDLIVTAPTVSYKIETTAGQTIEVNKPSDMPPNSEIAHFFEPIVEVNILTPNEYVGTIMTLCINSRGSQKGVQYSANQVSLSFEIPLSEVVLNFYDKLKSISQGYASMDYQFKRMEKSELSRLDILINGDYVGALSLIVHRTQVEKKGRALCEALKATIPRQMYEVAIQAAIGGKILSRTTVKALRKNVTAKCYGGDISRKKKLLEKQKKGKRRMKNFGKVSIPQEAFLSILNLNQGD